MQYEDAVKEVNEEFTKFLETVPEEEKRLYALKMLRCAPHYVSKLVDAKEQL